MATAAHSILVGEALRGDVKTSFYSKVKYFKYSFNKISQTLRPGKGCTYTKIPSREADIVRYLT